MCTIYFCVYVAWISVVFVFQVNDGYSNFEIGFDKKTPYSNRQLIAHPKCKEKRHVLIHFLRKEGNVINIKYYN